MGQQQLVLILLVTVVVAIATILAINTMQDSHIQANQEALRQKMMDASTLAQAYFRKNKMLGGGGGTYQNITLDHLNIEASDSELGEFSLEPGDKSFTLTAVPVSGGENIVGVIYSDRIEFISAEESE
ncbi:hypothetical protein [Gracilimonas tropica]|uniref:hypothetical protein n=1 Tax=Gracilimonas tropica TaxID=454600 RepID=UPI0006886651|nr:hypothetical protein [Gracilimonas tropica]